jgi:hypothetical protein
MGEYKFKRVDENCYEDLENLHRSTFKENPLINYYKKKMDTNYLKVSHLGYLAYTGDNKPAAFYGVYPCMMEFKGKLYLAAQSGDTMTDPAHGGKGLFTTLAKMTYDLAKEEGVEFIFGFPNKNSYPGFVKKLSWLFNENMRDYQVKVRTLPVAAVVKKLKFLSPLYHAYLRFVFGFYKTEKEFQPSSAIDINYGGVHRSKEFFTYKSFYKNYLIQIAGRTTWIKIDGGLLIGDIEIGEQNDAAKVIDQIKKMAVILGCTKISFSVGKDTYWDLVLRGKLSCEENTYIGHLDLTSGLPLEKFKYMMADYDTF